MTHPTITQTTTLHITTEAAPDEVIVNGRRYLPAESQPGLKEQALKALLHMDQGQHNERALIIRRALEQLPDDPAVTPAAPEPAPAGDVPLRAEAERAEAL